MRFMVLKHQVDCIFVLYFFKIKLCVEAKRITKLYIKLLMQALKLITFIGLIYIKIGEWNKI